MPPKRKEAGIPDVNTQIDDMTTRTLSLRLLDGGAPATLDEKTRSVGVIAATESPVEIWDNDRWEILPEVLLMSGCQFPESRQVPLLDTHSRYSTSSVIGSCRELNIGNGQLVGRAHYSEVGAADDVWRKTKEGHLTDYSIGYRVLESTYVAEGESTTLDGQLFEGPLKIATSWRVKELSACPIGADELAKTRAATRSPQTIPQKENTMDKQTRAFLESRGLPKTATDEEAIRFLETLDVREMSDEETMTVAEARKLAKDEARAERVRCDEIRSMCSHYGFDDLATELINKETSVDEARAAVMKKHMEKEPSGQNVGHRGEIVFGADERDKFRSAGTDSLLIRSGIEIADPSAGARDLAGLTLRELAREALRMAGQSSNGAPMEMLSRALTTSDFPLLLADSANKSLLQGFETAEETWGTWCGIGSVSDFKTHTAVRAGETDDLDEIGDDDEYQYGDRSEQAESYNIATYGKLFAITRQTLINDDLSALTDIPMAHGEAWKRKVGDLAYAVLTSNAAMGDGTALFHASHGNIGTAGAVSEATIAEAIKKMKLQKDIGGKRRLNIQPRFFIAPVSVEGAAEVFFNSNQFAAGDSAATRTNPYAGNKFIRVYDPRLDDASEAAYYMAGAKGKTVKLFFLNGNQLPTLETKNGWSRDGIEYKVRGDAGAKAMSWKGLFFNAGA